MLKKKKKLELIQNKVLYRLRTSQLYQFEFILKSRGTGRKFVFVPQCYWIIFFPKYNFIIPLMHVFSMIYIC